jgi:hypothetical protein
MPLLVMRFRNRPAGYLPHVSEKNPRRWCQRDRGESSLTAGKPSRPARCRWCKRCCCWADRDQGPGPLAAMTSIFQEAASSARIVASRDCGGRDSLAQALDQALRAKIAVDESELSHLHSSQRTLLIM